MADHPNPDDAHAITGRTWLEQILERFEKALQAGQRPAPEDYLPADLNQRRVALAELLPEDLEWRLRMGEPARVEHYLKRFPELTAGSPILVDLLQVEFRQRRRVEADLPLQEFIQRFPHFEHQLRQWQTDYLSRPPASLKDGMDTGPELAPQAIPLSPTGRGEKDEVAVVPAQLGRYEVLSLLGEGGFGAVYKAYDPELRRDVAIKVPRRHLIARPEDVEAYLAEGRVLAQLHHPHIVPVHDCGRSADGLCYIVSMFIPGSDLAKKMKQARPGFAESAQLVAVVAEALHYAHGKGLVHRDIKPGNILIDATGQPYVADFGLALKEEEVGKGGRICGTPAYMSPEQANGEGHRVDGRSDIFSLGVVFYELLTGRRPFRAHKTLDLIAQITTQEARPPRQIDDTIPRELERICLKALAKRAVERYTTAKDMAGDLRHFLAEPSSSQDKSAQPCAPAVSAGAAAPARLTQPGHTPPTPTPDWPLKIVPKGLRSFDAQDADFFLELLPGPRDRDGLPDSIRFWKSRIEETDADNTFPVGLIYGPSGCGKSSLVKAGLLPRLAGHVNAVYVEAAANETESRLVHGLRKRCPGLPAQLALKETLAALRQGQGVPGGKKVLIVLDQFEQWLHAHREEQHTELVQALRQCEGGRVQCLVLVRDDFWLAISRFLRELEIRLLEGQNSALVDLFDLDHARKVLSAFGGAFGKLPPNAGAVGKEQSEFLNLALAGLAQEGKIVCVQLALFAEMMKGKSWTPATLKAVGGARGVGVTFLEETFSATTAPPEHRYHQKAARAVLKALLPEAGTDIKGHLRSTAELLEASGYAGRPRDFEGLLRILDSELRLVTPTDPEGKEGADDAPSGVQAGQQYLQLTHDYVVPALRDWLTRKQKETRRGRAELLLADRAGVWTTRPENRQLPSLPQWFSIRWLTRKKNWTGPQRAMMRRATRFHALRAGVLGLVLMVLGYGAYEIHGRVQADHLVRTLARAETREVLKIIDDLAPYRRWAETLLVQQVAIAEADSKERLRACLALTSWNSDHVDYLAEQLLGAQPEMVPVLIQGLQVHGADLRERLWIVLENDRADGGQRLRSAGALAAYDSDNPRWNKVAGDVVRQLVAEQQLVLPTWAETLRPVRHRLLEPLVERLAEADPVRFPPLLLLLQAYREEAVPLLQRELEKTPATSAAEEEKDSLGKRHARVAAALVQLGQPDKVWPMLQHHGKDPRRRTYLLHWLGPLGVEPELLVRRLDQEDDVTARRALLLSLGEVAEDKWAASKRRELVQRLLKVYRADPDAGVHAAAEWLLRRWGKGQELNTIDGELVSKEPQTERQWYVNGQRQTLSVIRGTVEFRMGAPPGKYQYARMDGPLHTRRIPRSFAIATKKVTQAQFRAFRKDHVQSKQFSPEEDAPVNNVSWYDAAAYCNWLSQQEGLVNTEWCYVPTADGKFGPGMKLAEDYLHRTGYRLPTEAEWEYACRSGAETAFSYGEGVDMLGYYAWYELNSDMRAHPVGWKKPNDRGLFDVHGNLHEWCQDRFSHYDISRLDNTIEDKEDILDVSDNDSRCLRSSNFNGQSTLLRCAIRVENKPATPAGMFYLVGLRPARTIAP